MLFNLTPDSLLVLHIKLIIALFYAAIETEQLNSLPNYYHQWNRESHGTINYLIMQNIKILMETTTSELL